MSLIDPLQEPPADEPVKGPGAGARLRNYFLTGLIITGPIGITLYLTWSVIQWVDGWVKPLLPQIYNPDTYLPFPVPGIGLIVAFFGLTVVGFLTANIAGRTIVGLGEQLLRRMPVVRNLYNGLKQIFETILSNRGQSFQRVGLVEYPRRGLWALVFVAADAKGEVDARIPGSERLISVFLPTTPNPTSGFLLFVPERDVIYLEMSVEDAAKLVISAGLVTPEYQAKTKALAEGAKNGETKPPALPGTTPAPAPEAVAAD